MSENGSTSPAGVDGRGVLAATLTWESLLTDSRHVQIVCVSTERNGEIDHRSLEDVCRKIASAANAPRPIILVIESTISPAWIETIVKPAFLESGWRLGRDIHVGCSPRRDWYIDNAHIMQNVPKIIGGSSALCTCVMKQLYGRVCTTLLVAPDAQHAAAVKVVENYYRYHSVLLTNQLAAMLPDFNMPDLLRLASSKWNQELYHPSLGIGGYCIPLAKDYLADSVAVNRRAFSGALELAESECALEILNRLYPEPGASRRVVILGLAYAPGIRVHTRSPTLRLVSFLGSRGWTVLVHDPMYSPEEIRAITGVEAARFPEDLGNSHEIVLMTGHAMYRESSEVVLRQWIGPTTRIVDNLGVWRDRVFPANSYVEVGSVLSPADGSRNAGPGEVHEIESAAMRDWLFECERSGRMDSVFEAVATITAIDRPYIVVDFAGERMRMGPVTDRVAALRGRPVDEWTRGERDSIGALALLGMARVRLEHVKLQLSLGAVATALRQQLDEFNAQLAQAGVPAEFSASQLPLVEVAKKIPEMRRRIDRHYHRIAEIDGATWHRAERVLGRDEVSSIETPQPLVDALQALGAHNVTEPGAAVRQIVQEARGDVSRVKEVLAFLLETAASDPYFEADHATLLAPRGTNLERPWEFGSADFLAWVVFRRGFVPKPPLADITTIRRSMYAHHSVKKERLARKYLAKYGPQSRASLEDDLGALGIYHNESEHHRGHQITGIQSALRNLMAIDIAHNGATLRIEGLTDFRLTRVTAGEAARFSIAYFPRFLAYGRTVGALLEAAYSDGLVLEPILGR